MNRYEEVEYAKSTKNAKQLGGTVYSVAYEINRKPLGSELRSGIGSGRSSSGLTPINHIYVRFTVACENYLDQRH